MVNGDIALSLTIVSSFLTSLQLLQSLLIADYRAALAYQGDKNAALRIILPCYRPLFIALILVFMFLSLTQGLCLLSGHTLLDNAHYVYQLMKLYGLCVLAIYCILPVLLIQKSVSMNGFWRAFFMIFPAWLCEFSIIIALIYFGFISEPLSYSMHIVLDTIYIIILIFPIILSSGILLSFIKCRVRLKSVSNRNAIELMFIFSIFYIANVIVGSIVVDLHGSDNSIAFSCLTFFIVFSSIILNILFPFALYRGLLADTKFWRGLGKHNQGGLNSDAQDTTRDSEARITRPTASSIDLSVASTSFQAMMSDISHISLDFAYVQVDRPIGNGATSEVYCGRFNNRLAAIKISTPPEITVEVLNVFAQEAKICSVLKHQNIVTFYGICVRPPQIGMVFELCEGGNLKSHLEKHSRMWTRALRVRACWHCAEAVAYLHSKGFIHRDIKAENFMVTRKLVVKLGDFGETGRVRNEESAKIRRMTVLGTVTHMAPELVDASKYYTQAVDVYALGMTFLEVWTGSNLYPDKNTFQIYGEVSKGQRPELPSDAPEPFIDQIRQAWDQRYQSRPTANVLADNLMQLYSDMTGTPLKRELSKESKRTTFKIRGLTTSKESDPPQLLEIDDVTDYTPKDQEDASRNSGFFVARVLLKAKALLHINDDVEDDDDRVMSTTTSPLTELTDRSSVSQPVPLNTSSRIASTIRSNMSHDKESSPSKHDIIGVEGGPRQPIDDDSTAISVSDDDEIKNDNQNQQIYDDGRI